jgi:predicted metal-dependent phosphoesterase TrpH
MLFYEQGRTEVRSFKWKPIERRELESGDEMLESPTHTAYIVIFLIVACVVLSTVITSAFAMRGVLMTSSWMHGTNDVGWKCQRYMGYRSAIIGDAAEARLHGKCIVAFDQHSHTNASDGEMNAEETVWWHRISGYDAFAVTDHYSTRSCKATKEAAQRIFPNSMVVLCGIEWSFQDFHCNIIFDPSQAIPTFFDSLPRGHPSISEIVDVIEHAHDAGAFVTFNHPRLKDTFIKYGITPLDIIDMGIDFVELINSDHVDEVALKMHVETGIHVIAGSDKHDSILTTTSYTLIGVESLTDVNVFRELKEKRTVVSFKPRA